MNYSLAREIYGMTPFCVDSQTLPAMTSILEDVKNRVNFEKLKNSESNIISFDNEKKMATRAYQLNTDENFEGVGLININGPILLNSGDSTLGMKQVSQNMKKMAKDSRVKGFILLMDSGGGSSSAVELMSDTINEIKSSDKQVHALIDVGGTLGSAAYGIASAANSISYQSDMSIVGSLGTMIQISGREANKIDPDGVKHLRLYATKSVSKNKEVEDALNKDNYEVIINELLDPVNERFLAMLKQNRSQLNESNLDGSIAFAKDSEGSYVDKKSNLEELSNQILNQSANAFSANNESINNNVTMTREQLKQEHPELFQEVVNVGVAAESERVKSWLAHLQTDSNAVVEGIESGKAITQSQREKFFVKQNKINQLAGIEGDNADDFTTPESSMGSAEEKEKKKQKEIEQVFGFELK